MKWRMAAVSLSTAISLALTAWVVPCEEGLWRALGLAIDQRRLRALGITMVLMGMFYLGPLAAYICQLRMCKQQSAAERVAQDLSGYWAAHGPLLAFRNLLFAPAAEELVFRGIVLTALSAAHGTSSVVLLSPCWFGAAHLHHLVEKLRTQSLMPALLSTAVQFAYTYVFGVMAALLFLRTGTLLTAMASHTICNFVGLPDMSFMSPRSELHGLRHGLLCLHGLGLLLFAAALHPLTAP